jgi:hypothetical protein
MPMFTCHLYMVIIWMVDRHRSNVDIVVHKTITSILELEYFDWNNEMNIQLCTNKINIEILVDYVYCR